MDISGTWTRFKHSEAAEFRVQSAAAYGQLLGLSTATGTPLDRRVIVGGIDLTVRRSLSTMFDGVDFANGRPAEQGMQIMRTLVAGAELVVAGD